jgi:fructose-1,6-bisphosphatase-3
MARCGYFSKEGSAMRQRGKDFLWFLWCGKNSPLAARERITTFERLFVADEKSWVEPKNPYYESWDNEALVDKILREFSLCGDGSHIINGHIPIKYKKGEEPIKAGGKLIVIDGGFSRAYRNTTGIGGCTLIYNADGMRISVHEPFVSPEDAVNKCGDILSESIVFDHADSKIRISDTDDGTRIKEKISDLVRLLSAYRHGEIKQKQSFT